MKMKPMYKYFISLLFLLFVCAGSAQVAGDTIRYTEKYGLRVGADLSRLVRSFLDDNYSGLELMADYRISKRFFIAGEIGTEENTVDEDFFNFTSSGSYIKVGFDYNTYENWYGMQNLIFVGMRYGFSTFSQTLNSYIVNNTNQYFDEGLIPGANPDLLREFDNLNAHWIEGVVGLKVELFNNLYLGASVRLNFLITDQASEVLPNLWVPGFNRVTQDSSIGLGYNYGLSYLIPIYRKKKGFIKKEEE